MPYCDSCIFYGRNKQCQRCGMYLPALELQMYNGQWYCPYCIMDMREKDAKLYKPKKPHITERTIREHCSRCGKSITDVVYYYKGKKLCKSCLDNEKGDGPMPPSVLKFSLNNKPKPMYSLVATSLSPVLSGFIDWLLYKLHLKKRLTEREVDAEIIAVSPRNRNEGRIRNKVYTKTEKEDEKKERKIKFESINKESLELEKENKNLEDKKIKEIDKDKRDR